MESNKDQQDRERERERQPAPPARPAQRPAEQSATGARERDEADKQIAEHLAATPEPPQPSQEEADAIKETVVSNTVVERDVKPDAPRTGYTTR